MPAILGVRECYANIGDIPALCCRSQHLCRAVAGRDLEGLPLYIMPQSQLAAEYGNAERCYAYTTPSLDLYLRPHIRDWRGRGPCMVINDLALAEAYEYMKPKKDQKVSADRTWPGILHLGRSACADLGKRSRTDERR